jgi:hypothetical protein
VGKNTNSLLVHFLSSQLKLSCTYFIPLLKHANRKITVRTYKSLLEINIYHAEAEKDQEELGREQYMRKL